MLLLMEALLKYTAILTIAVSCQNSGSTEPAETDTLKSITVKDTVPTVPVLKPYSGLEYQKKEVVAAAPGPNRLFSMLPEQSFMP